MDLKLTDNKALITGSSGGIGEAIARRLASEGASVIVHGRDPQRTHDVAQSICSQGGKATLITGELTSPSDVATIIDFVNEEGPVDIFVNNAGVFYDRGWDETTPEDWAFVYDANVVSFVRLAKALIPPMKSNKWGRIIQLGTGEATNPFPKMLEYAASKAATVNATVSLAKHLSHSGITVNTVSPGIVVTPGVEAFYRQEADKHGWPSDWESIEHEVLATVLDNPTGRLGRPEEVADLVAFVASPLSGYINGANLRIDGGSTAVI